LAIALVLVVFGLVEVVSYIHLSLLIMPFYALNMVLVASGYALQILLRRLPPWLAIAFVSLGSSLVAFGNFWVRGWKPILALSLTGSAISSELLGYAFWQRRSLWFPAGVFFGLRLAPTGGGLEFISWASRLEALRSSMTWNIGFGLPRILIFLLCALLLWRLSFLSGPDRDENSGANFSTSQEVQNGSLSKWFFLGSWTIASGLGLILVVSQGVEIVRATVFREDTIFPEDIKGLSGGALLASLFALIVFCLLLHKMWGAIEDDQTTVTPGKAVGFLFIPLFNIYWGFQAIARFPDEFNMYAKRHSINVPSLRSGLFLAYVILALMVWIPVLNIVTAPAMYIVEMVMIGRICDGVNAL